MRLPRLPQHWSRLPLCTPHFPRHRLRLRQQRLHRPRPRLLQSPWRPLQLHRRVRGAVGLTDRRKVQIPISGPGVGNHQGKI